jgi:hypothetical protein
MSSVGLGTTVLARTSSKLAVSHKGRLTCIYINNSQLRRISQLGYHQLNYPRETDFVASGHAVTIPSSRAISRLGISFYFEFYIDHTVKHHYYILTVYSRIVLEKIIVA